MDKPKLLFTTNVILNGSEKQLKMTRKPSRGTVDRVVGPCEEATNLLWPLVRNEVPKDVAEVHPAMRRLTTSLLYEKEVRSRKEAVRLSGSCSEPPEK